MESGDARPSPLEIARRIRRQATAVPSARPGIPASQSQLPLAAVITDPAEAAIQLADGSPDIAWIWDQLGMKSLPETLADLFVEDAVCPLATLLNPEARTAQIVNLWSQHLREHDLTVLEMLAFEQWFSVHPTDTAAALPGGMRFDKTLHVCRQHVGLALYEHAKEINWARPFVFTRTLSLARKYLLGVVAQDHLTNENTRRQFLGKAAVSTVLISRYELCDEDSLLRAISLLRDSMNIGNPPQEAIPYLLEGTIRLYDLNGDINLLVSAKDTYDHLRDHRPRDAYRLNMAEIWLRLAEKATSARGRSFCIDKARAHLDQTNPPPRQEPADRVRFAILTALVGFLQAEAPHWPKPLTIRKIKTPFGLAEYAHELLLLEGSEKVSSGIIGQLLDTLRKLMRVSRGEPICRRVLADLLSTVSASAGHTFNEQIAFLKEAIEVRRGDYNSPLSDESSRVRQGNDLVALGALTQDGKTRRDGVVELIREALADPSTCNPLVILGKNIEAQGIMPNPEFTNVERYFGEDPRAQPWLHAIGGGDANALYRAAAARAIKSPDVRHRHLGGRSNALTVEDHLGFSTDTFVFKQTTFRSLKLDSTRASNIDDYLARACLGKDFGLVDHITDLEESGEHSSSDLRTVTSVRRFAHGSVLSDIQSTDPGAVASLLTRVARYLGHIHALEHSQSGGPTGVRKELKTKEIGRWFRALASKSDDRSYFDRWWHLVGDLTALPRRDAHAFNWLITDEERILAVDLEATGWRPVGYEVAQLTDDVSLLPVTEEGWAQRQTILAAYAEVLTNKGIEISDVDLLKGYFAGLIARAVRALSDPAGNRRQRRRGEELLQLIAAVALDAEVREFANDIAGLWAHRLGAPAGLALPDLADAKRKHVSRALAFHLRHNSAMQLSPAGWVSAELLTAQLKVDGVHVSVTDVLAVASAIDETRFETSATHIRAMYGHSVPVDIDYESPGDRPILYHATAMQSINSIFQNNEGLRPMSRQWVHMSIDWQSALRTGERKGSAVLLALRADRGPEVSSQYAGGKTWLARSIPAGSLEIVPVYKMFNWILTMHSTP